MGAWKRSDGRSTSHLKDLKDVNEAIIASSIPIHANKALSRWCSNIVINREKELLCVPKAFLKELIPVLCVQKKLTLYSCASESKKGYILQLFFDYSFLYIHS